MWNSHKFVAFKPLDITIRYDIIHFTKLTIRHWELIAETSDVSLDSQPPKTSSDYSKIVSRVLTWKIGRNFLFSRKTENIIWSLTIYGVFELSHGHRPALKSSYRSFGWNPKQLTHNNWHLTNRWLNVICHLSGVNNHVRWQRSIPRLWPLLLLCPQ